MFFWLSTKRTLVISALLITGWLTFGLLRLRSMTQPSTFWVVKHYRLSGVGVNGEQWDKIFASREDGAFVEASTSTQVVQLILPRLHQTIIINRQALKRSTFPIRDDETLGISTYRKYAGSRCSNFVPDTYVYIGEEQHLGIPVVTYGNGGFLPSQKRYQDIVKVAPSLNCFPLVRDTIWVDSHGSITSQSEEMATEAHTGNVHTQLFDIPANLKEVLPSELLNDVIPNYATDNSLCAKRTRSRLDSFYTKSNHH